jgi:hypothetical protein
MVDLRRWVAEGWGVSYGETGMRQRREVDRPGGRRFRQRFTSVGRP